MEGKLTVGEVLERAADLIEPEGAWTQGVPARNAKGRYVAPFSEEAVCWCLAGAIQKFAPNDFPYTKYLEPLGQSLRTEPVLWNDRRERKQAEVVALLRTTAAKLSTLPSEKGA